MHPELHPLPSHISMFQIPVPPAQSPGIPERDDQRVAKRNTGKPQADSFVDRIIRECLGDLTSILLGLFGRRSDICRSPSCVGAFLYIRRAARRGSFLQRRTRLGYEGDRR